MHDLSPKIAPLHGDHAFLGPPESIATPVQPFVHCSHQNVIGHVDALRPQYYPFPYLDPI